MSCTAGGEGLGGETQRGAHLRLTVRHIYSVLNLKTKTFRASGCFLVDSMGGLSSCCLSVPLFYCISRSLVQICAPLPKTKLQDEQSMNIRLESNPLKPAQSRMVGTVRAYIYKTNQKQNSRLNLECMCFYWLHYAELESWVGARTAFGNFRVGERKLLFTHAESCCIRN